MSGHILFVFKIDIYYVLEQCLCYSSKWLIFYEIVLIIVCKYTLKNIALMMVKSLMYKD